MSTRLQRAIPQLGAAFRNLSNPTALIRHASSSNSPTPIQTPNQNDVSSDPDYVSIQEIKGLIGKYDGGDKDAVPSILEAILKRKLVQMKNNLKSDPDLEQLVQDRRLEFESEDEEDENIDNDDYVSEEESDLDSDWSADEENKLR